MHAFFNGEEFPPKKLQGKETVFVIPEESKITLKNRKITLTCKKRDVSVLFEEVDKAAREAFKAASSVSMAIGKKDGDGCACITFKLIAPGGAILSQHEGCTTRFL